MTLELMEGALFKNSIMMMKMKLIEVELEKQKARVIPVA